MEQTKSKSAAVQNLRRIGMILGIIIFALFAYKASADVANPTAISGVQHSTRTANTTPKQTGLPVSPLSLANLEAPSSPSVPAQTSPRTDENTPKEQVSSGDKVNKSEATKHDGLSPKANDSKERTQDGRSAD